MHPSDDTTLMIIATRVRVERMALADVCPKGSLRPAPEPWLPVWPANQLTD